MNSWRALTAALLEPRAPLSGSTGTPAAIQRGVGRASIDADCWLPRSSVRCSVRPLTAGLERAAGAATQRPAAPCAVFERSRPRSARREHPSRLRPDAREIDRPRTPVLHRPSACTSCERRWRRGGTRAGSLRNRPVRAGLRRAWPQAGRLRAWERPPGSGGPVRAAVVGRRGSALKWHAGHGAPLLLPPSARHARPYRRLAQRRRAGRWAPDFESVRPRPCGARVKHRVGRLGGGAVRHAVCGRSAAGAHWLRHRRCPYRSSLGKASQSLIPVSISKRRVCLVWWWWW